MPADRQREGPLMKPPHVNYPRTGIHTLILWKNRVEIADEGYRRYLSYRVIATATGAAFWCYSDNVLVFLGTNVQVTWS